MKIIATAPTRISLFGGGTDLPVYYQKFGGAVVSLAVNIRQHIELTDEAKAWTIPEKANPDFYRAFFKEYEVSLPCLQATFDAQIESGLGSSASAAVALLAAINKWHRMDMNRMEIAEKAWDIEVNKLGLYGGKQDQYAAAYGGMNQFIFLPTGGVLCNAMDHKIADLVKRHLLLVDTGLRRSSSKIQEQLKTLTAEKVEALHTVKHFARLGLTALKQYRIDSVGKYLDCAWEAKKKCNPLMTNVTINEIYDTAIHMGAWGGKLMGSGGGGYMFFISEPQDKNYIMEALKEYQCKEVDYSVDWNGVEARKI